MHNVRIPLRTKFSAPERYGLAPFKTRNLAITTADGETLGAWHTLFVSFMPSAHYCDPYFRLTVCALFPLRITQKPQHRLPESA